MKKKIQILMVALMLLMSMTLTACLGFGKGDDDESDPNLGVYVAKTAELSGFEIGVDDVFDGGFTIELKKKGKGKAQIGEDDASIKWKLDGDSFHAEGGGVELDGTLKNGVMILEDVIGSGVTLTLECEEAMNAAASSGDDESSSGGSVADRLKSKKDAASDGPDKSRLESFLGDSSEEVGRWNLSTVTQDGQVYMKNDLRKKGIESWIQVDPDGTGQIYLVGDLMDMEWGDGQIVVPDNGEGGRDEYRYSITDDFLVLVDGEMVLAFEREGGNDDVSLGGDSASVEIPRNLMARYEGDWHGIILFFNAKGTTFAKRDNSKCDVAARIAMDENGNVTPYFAEAKDDDVQYNFRNLEAELDPDMECMFLSGELLGGTMELAAVGEENGLLHMYFTISADNGDSIDAELAMRHLDTAWQSDDYPMYPKEGLDYYRGRSLEWRLEDFGTMPGGLPAQTNITGWQ
ncbi:MAG: hypothetical protein J5518_01820 [Lachnospiraceae bacterium]|nr:hypothetical protein [Lachnospiraceae bacterium]